jgi:hypothetical protein
LSLERRVVPEAAHGAIPESMQEEFDYPALT